LISSGATSEEFTDKKLKDCSENNTNVDESDYFFRVVSSGDSHVNKIIDFMKNNGLKNPALFYLENSPFSKPIKDKLVIKLSQEKINTNINPNLIFNDKGSKPEESFEDKKFDAKRIRKIFEDKQLTVDSLVVLPDGELTKSQDNAAKLITEFGGEKWIIGTWTLYKKPIFDSIINIGGKLINDPKIAFYSPWEISLASKSFKNNNDLLWGVQSGKPFSKHPVNALSYDATSVIYQALNNLVKDKQDVTSKQLRINLLDLHNQFIGANDVPIKFDENGNRDDLEGLMLKPVLTKVLTKAENGKNKYIFLLDLEPN
jgi:ABC-type branched-subunit amino acid transport system substrate-binding protein